MNVLILTPDRVGSTLLQRLITIHMQSHNFGKPVINIHELTNGLELYQNSKLNINTIKHNFQEGYKQSLPDIISLLNSANHYKTARLAHYHIKRRNDPVEDQRAFYDYINKNFFIISARRENLLEHALSWCIFTVSKRLNVYGHDEKIATYKNIYKNKIYVEKNVLIRFLNAYVEYVRWAEDTFDIGSYFEYGKDLPQIESYINNLNLFGSDQKQNFWQNMFNMEWSDWNRCHYLVSDMSTGSDNIELLPWVPKDENKEYLPAVINTSHAVQVLDREFLQQHVTQYLAVDAHIQQMVTDGILATGVPIKLQTMLEKSFLIENFKECLDIYNQWCQDTGFCRPIEQALLLENSIKELQSWHAPESRNLLR